MLAAGQGTRMKSRVPKVLHKVCGREMVRLVLDAVAEAGIDSTAVVVDTDAEPVRQLLGSTVAYAVQPQPLGTGHALLQARSLVDGADTVAVLHGDVPLVEADTLRTMLRVHRESDADITLLAATVDHPGDLGRVIRDGSGRITAVVEARDADDEVCGIQEVNGGVYCFRESWLWPSLASLPASPGGEVYLTDLVSVAAGQGMAVESVKAGPEEILGVNTRVELAAAEAALRRRIRERWMLAGVSIPDPTTVYIDLDVELGHDTVLLPNTHVTGESRVGTGCVIGPDTTVSGSAIGAGCRIVNSVVDGAVVEDDVDIGPFSHIRPGTHLESEVHIGSSVEVKNSRLGRGARSGHFSYIGDAQVGANVNIGAGTVTCNYDGVRKHPTIIGEGAFIGSGSMLVAPVTIGARAQTGAGAVVTRDLPPDALAVGAPARLRAKQPHPRGE